MNKRKMPQWLLDVTTNNNAKHNKNVEIHNQNENSTESVNGSSGMITVVPLSNLLSPSRSIGQSAFSTRNNELPEDNRNTDIVTNRDTNDEMQCTPNDDPVQPAIKKEVIDEEEPSSLNTADTQPSDQPLAVVVKTEIKEEPTSSDDVGSTPTTTQSPTSSVTNAIVDQMINVKTEVTSTPTRRSCNYGVKCYRRNASHRSDEAHPGDSDYRRPTLPDAVPGTPACPWGAACYRRNPQHFVQLSHPPAMNTTPATTNVIPQTNAPSRTRRPVNYPNPLISISVDIDSDDEDDDDEEEDPFINDGSSDEYDPDK